MTLLGIYSKLKAYEPACKEPVIFNFVLMFVQFSFVIQDVNAVWLTATTRTLTLLVSYL